MFLISFHVEAGDLWQLRWIILSVDTCVQRRAKTHRFWNGGRKKTNPCATNVKKLRGFEWLFFTTADTSLTHQFHSYFIWFLIHARNEIDNFAVKKFSRNLFLFAQISNRFISSLDKSTLNQSNEKLALLGFKWRWIYNTFPSSWTTCLLK